MSVLNHISIIFLGTPEFAVESLKALIESGGNVVGVITSPDQPAGRGLKLKESAVKQFAIQNNLNVLQPSKLSEPTFIEEVKKLKADLQIVVAFRMMPEVLWNMPPLGTFNLHASLLPQYRGAAPINRAIMNGEHETGVTTFFLKHVIDTGNILFSEKVNIDENETAGELHDRLKVIGANLVLKTVTAIENKTYIETVQQNLSDVALLKTAPKIFKADCKIDWNKNVHEIHNHIRGLAPYPTACFNLSYPDGKQESVKIYRSGKIIDLNCRFTGDIMSDQKNNLYIPCKHGYITVEELQLPGKKKMNVTEFLKGNNIQACKVVAD